MKVVSLYIPTDPPESVQWVHNVERDFASMFGGCTSYNATGSWLNKHKILVSEPVVVVQAVAFEDTILARNISTIHHLARQIKLELNQEAVLYTITEGMAVCV